LSGSGERPKISVVTATYQRAGTLPRLYESLLAQTSREFEWVVVDDGSSDGTEELVRAWQRAGDLPIEYSRQDNQGKHGAVNRAVERSRGEFCAIIDSDDWYFPEALERMLACWETIPSERRPEFADVEGLRVDPDGDLVCDVYPSDVFDSDAFELIALHGVEGDKIGMYRRDVLLEFPFPEDLGWHVAPALVWNRIATRYLTRHVNEVWAYTDYRAGGLTDRKNELRIRFADARLIYWTEFAAMPKRMRAKERYRAHANRVRYSLLTGIPLRAQLAESTNRLWTAAAWPAGLLLYLRDRRWLARRVEGGEGNDGGS
jgi:glycosyltransferase involved in cell wall biosynthesis